jgi:hypothetical protein
MKSIKKVAFRNLDARDLQKTWDAFRKPFPSLAFVSAGHIISCLSREALYSASVGMNGTCPECGTTREFWGNSDAPEFLGARDTPNWLKEDGYSNFPFFNGKAVVSYRRSNYLRCRRCLHEWREAPWHRSVESWPFVALEHAFAHGSYGNEWPGSYSAGTNEGIVSLELYPHVGDRHCSIGQEITSETGGTVVVSGRYWLTARYERPSVVAAQALLDHAAKTAIRRWKSDDEQEIVGPQIVACIDGSRDPEHATKDWEGAQARFLEIQKERNHPPITLGEIVANGGGKEPPPPDAQKSPRLSQ